MPKPLFLLTLLLLYLVILLRAGNHPIVILGFSCGIFTITLFSLITGVIRANSGSNNLKNSAYPRHRLLSSPLPYLIGFQIWIFLQYLTGISYDKTATLQTFILGCAYCLTTLLISQIREKAVSYLYIAVVAMAVFQSLYGVYVLLSGIDSILWWPKEYYLEHATGTFVNPNHFAAFLNLSIGLVLCSLFHKISDSRKIKSAPFIRKIFLICTEIFSIEGLILIVLLLGVLCSRSIGAISALILTLIIFAVFLILWASKINVKTALTLSSLALAGLITVSIFIAPSEIHSEIEGISFTFERRTEIFTAGLRAAADFWLTGSGAGSFYTVFPAYRDLDVGNAFYYHAHNDYIEFLTEFGLIGLLLLGGFMFFALKKNLKHLSRRSKSSPQRKVFAYATIFTTINIALHSIVDFPLQTTAYALAFLCIISVNCFSAPLERTQLRKKQGNKKP